MQRILVAFVTCLSLFSISITTALADDTVINLRGKNWLGSLNLDTGQLESIKKAMEKALNAPIDSEQECGEVRMDCIVRAAREWTVDGDRYREMVIHIHTIGQASSVVAQVNGQWPAISTAE